jgi:hypothetical protein
MLIDARGERDSRNGTMSAGRARISSAITSRASLPIPAITRPACDKRQRQR